MIKINLFSGLIVFLFILACGALEEDAENKSEKDFEVTVKCASEDAPGCEAGLSGVLFWGALFEGACDSFGSDTDIISRAPSSGSSCDENGCTAEFGNETDWSGKFPSEGEYSLYLFFDPDGDEIPGTGEPFQCRSFDVSSTKISFENFSGEGSSKSVPGNFIFSCDSSDNLKCSDGILDGVTVKGLISKTACTDMGSDTKYLATATTAATCDIGSCQNRTTTNGLNNWDASISEGTYYVLIFYDVDDSGSPGSGEPISCEEKNLVGSGANFENFTFQF